MSPDSQKTPASATAIEFKSSTFSVPVLVLSSDDLALIEQQLQKKIQLAPDFFKNSPVVFDVQWLNQHNLTLDINALFTVIRNAGLLPIGIRGGNELQNKQALALHIPIHSVHNGATSEAKQKTRVAEQSVTDAPNRVEPALTIPTTLITQPIRSGQRVYAEGDLIIMAQVSAGAEIMAVGNIHVYSTLRGRALAGVQGNTDARIFCFDLAAELISIAGTYKISEDINHTDAKPVQIYLQEHTLIIKAIT